MGAAVVHSPFGGEYLPDSARDRSRLNGATKPPPTTFTFSWGTIIAAVCAVLALEGSAIGSYVLIKTDAIENRRALEAVIAGINTRVAVLEAKRQADEQFQRDTYDQLRLMIVGISELKATQRANSWGPGR
jgi:pimeloyl-ACP methyl ester carboxylesterase